MKWKLIINIILTKKINYLTFKTIPPKKTRWGRRTSLYELLKNLDILTQSEI